MPGRGRFDAFEAEVTVDPGFDREEGDGFARALVAAADIAAGDIPSGESREFVVTGIEVKVESNPGPTSYKVIITPKI